MKSSHVTAVSLMNVWSHNSTDNIDDVLFLGAFRLTLALWKIMDRISCTCLSIYFYFFWIIFPDRLGLCCLIYCCFFLKNNLKSISSVILSSKVQPESRLTVLRGCYWATAFTSYLFSSIIRVLHLAVTFSFIIAEYFLLAVRISVPLGRLTLTVV